MNEFTKEELEFIKIDMRKELRIAPLSKESKEQYENLIVKIQSIINNYCEHTWFLYVSQKGSVQRCHKCNKEFPLDNQ